MKLPQNDEAKLIRKTILGILDDLKLLWIILLSTATIFLVSFIVSKVFSVSFEIALASVMQTLYIFCIGVFLLALVAIASYATYAGFIRKDTPIKKEDQI